MNLTEYARILIQRGWILVLLALIAGGSAYVFSSQQTPIYRASQVVVIQPSRADLGLAEASIRLLNSLVVIMNSEQVAAQIIEDLRLDMTPGQLKSNVTIASDQLRLVIQIDVRNPDPAIAAEVARAWGLRLQAYRDAENQQVQRQDRVDAVLPDLPTIGQDSPRPRITAIAGAIMGLLIGGVIVFVLEYVEGSVIRRREDLENANLSVLAAIPQFES